MDNAEFEKVLHRAISGCEEALEQIFELYEPLFFKYSCVKGEYKEEMHQQLWLHIALNIHYFKI